jgi:hypothetical protein
VVATILAVLSAIYAIHVAQREADAYPLFIFLGAGLAIALEPVGDIFTQVVYPHLEQVSLFSAWGRSMPLWMLPNYLFFFCAPVLWLMRNTIRRDVSATKWWGTYVTLTVLVAAFEMPGINASSWKYYGVVRPWTINTYPIWVAFNNAQCLLSTATAVHLLRRAGVGGTRAYWYIALVPLVIAGSHIAPSLPVATATHSGAGITVVNAAALLTIALNIFLVRVGLLLVQGAAKN